MQQVPSVVYQQTDDPGKVRLLSQKRLTRQLQREWIDFMAPVTVEEPIDNVDIKSGNDPLVD